MKLEIIKKQKEKKLLFEYFVGMLFSWNKELDPNCQPQYTKLQLQKLLFLTSAVNATKDDHKLLDVYDRFYALPYGPVELDIYEAMNDGSFMCLTIEDRNCMYKMPEETSYFEDLDQSLKKAISNSIMVLKEKNINYFSMAAFDLVSITHKWSVWKDAYSIATLCGSRQEKMSTEAICTSQVKSYSN